MAGILRTGLAATVFLFIFPSFYPAHPAALASAIHPHDDLTNAAQLSELHTAWTNTTAGATVEPGEEVIEPPIPPISIWARWVAPRPGTFRVIVSPSFSCSVFSEPQFIDFQSLTRFRVGTLFNSTGGEAYYFRIVPSAEESSGPFVLRVGEVPANERMTNALQVSGDEISVLVDNWVTVGRYEENYAAPWYKWTAPDYGLLTYSIRTNTPADVVYVLHDQPLTVDANAFGAPWPNHKSLLALNTMVVSAGTTYLFGIRASPSPSRTLNLTFRRTIDPVPTNGFLGGNVFWTVQTNTVFSPPSAFQTAPLNSNEFAFLEYTLRDKGWLKYRSKLEGSGALSVEISPFPTTGNTMPPTYFAHSWAERSIRIGSSNTAVRFILRPLRVDPETSPTGWLDDIQFIADTPTPPQIEMSLEIREKISVFVPVEPLRSTMLQSSPNLLEWNLESRNYSPAATNYLFSIPIDTNETQRFFRIYLIGGLNPT